MGLKVRLLVVLAIATSLEGCGAEVASTAATGAAIKKQELEEGMKTQERAQQKINEAVEQARQRAQHADPAAR